MTIKLTGTTLLVHDSVIQEPPLDKFKQFIELYNLAFSLLEKDDSLAMAWASNDEFKNIICQALLDYGVSETGLSQITNSELSLLILADTENQKPGLIFQQNNCFPKLQSFPQRTVLWKGLKLHQLLPSNLQNILSLLKLGIHIYRKLGVSTK